MPDARLYRAALLPAVVALFVAAFALADRPAPASSPLAAAGFQGDRAFGGPGARPERDSLRELAAAFPDRRPGSPGDAGVAERVARAFAATGFQVTRSVHGERTVDRGRRLETVVGVRPGLSSRRIVVLAHRDALRAPGLAELSGTAALIELARVFRSREPAGAVRGGERQRAFGRDLRRTLVLVSTSGGTGGAAGARRWARGAGDEVDAVLVLGDLASEQVRKPWVVPWSTRSGHAPLGLQRTLEAAVRQEVGSEPGGARAGGQWVRRALPLTVSEQGPVRAAGLPAVALSVTGERGPAPGARVVEERLDEFGRGVLRAVSAIDAAGGAQGERPAFSGAAARGGVMTVGNVLPDLASRLLVGALLAPALVLAIDGAARARRRRSPVGRWLAWLALLALPLLAAWAWARMLGLVGAIPAPPAPVRPGATPVGAGELAAFASVALAGLLAWLGLRGGRARLRRAGGGAGLAVGGAGAALGLVLAGTSALVWLANPFAAALLVPAAHLWLLAAAPGSTLRGWRAALAVALGLVPLGLVALHYALALGLGPLELAWTAFEAVAGGHFGLPVAAVAAVLVACLVAVLAIVRARGPATPGPAAPHGRIVTRGPVTYAGPGSLGGTESALR